MSDVNNLLNSKLAVAKEHPSLCLAPYTSMYVRQHADPTKKMRITCCCNIDVNKFTVGPSNDPFKDIKYAMDQGILPPACHLCKKEEDHNAQSERIRFLLSTPQDKIQQFIQSKYVDNFELMVVFSNLCNLSCRSCGPTNSSTYAKVTNNNSVQHLINDITDIADYWNLITEVISDNINKYQNFEIHLMGGEPLIQPGVIKLFDWLIENNLIDKITLKLTTALSANLTDKLLTYFKQFKFVQFNLSIDSVGENYQYVRWPMKFEKIERNVNYIVNNLTNGKYNCGLDPVFSLNNIFYIDEYLDYWYNWFITKKLNFKIMTTNLVAGTAFIDVEALPIKYREPLKNILSKCLDHILFKEYSADTIHLYNFIKTTLTELDTYPDNYLLWNKFLTHTAQFDRRTNTNFNVLNSKLYNLLTDVDIKIFTDKLNFVEIKTPYSVW